MTLKVYHTPGKRTPDGIREWTLNSAVCGYIAEYLAPYNCEILRTDHVTGETDVPLSERMSKALKARADILLSIHHNAAGDGWGNAAGTETYAARETHPDSVRLSELIAVKLAKETGLRNRGAKRAGFAVINTTRIPAVLVEGGFMDGKSDSYYIRTEQGQRAYAKAVADALVEFFEIAEKEETEVRYTYYEDMPEWAQPTVSKLVKLGLLKGDGDGVLDLSEDMLRVLVINDRAGMYK